MAFQNEISDTSGSGGHMKRRAALLPASFLLPLLIQCAAFAALRITPFGDKTLVYGDSNAFYINYIAYLSRVLKGEHGFLYSFNSVMGSGISGMYSYLCAPYMLLFLAADWEYLPQAFSASVMLMASLSGLTMYLLVSDVRGHRLGNLVFSTCYALMGFSVVNNYNIVFSAGVAAFPLVILGLRKLLREESPLLYILSIAYSVASGVQTGFVNCTASLLIFLTLLWADPRFTAGSRKRAVLRFLLCSVTGGLLSCALWLPGFLVGLGGRAQQTTLENYVFTDNGPLLQIFSRLFSGASSVSQLINGLPAIFCGILTLALVILFFMDGEKPSRKKIAALALLGVYLLSFYIRTLTTVFQGFITANWFNYRHSYVFSFLLLLLAAEEADAMDRIPRRNVLRCGWILCLAALLVFSQSYEFISGGLVVMDFILLAVMGGFFWFYRTKPERADRRSFTLILLICTCFQLFANYYFSAKQILDAEGWGQSIQEFSDDIFRIQPPVYGLTTAKDGFYRIENEQPHTINDGMLFDYPSAGGVTNTALVYNNAQKLGLSLTGAAWVRYGEGTPQAMDSLLGIRYLLSKNDLTEEKGYDRLLQVLDTGIYENPYALPIAILSDEAISQVSLEEQTDVFAIQNQIWKAMTGGTEDLFTEETQVSFTFHNPADPIVMTKEEADAALSPEEPDEKQSGEEKSGTGSNAGGDGSPTEGSGLSEASADSEQRAKEYSPYIEFTFTASQDGPVYFYDYASNIEGYGSSEDLLQYVGTYQPGDTVTGRIYLPYTINKAVFVETLKELHICTANIDALAAYSALLRGRDAVLQKDSDSVLSGSVTAEEGQRLLLTVPYDEGWTFYLDGSPAALDQTAGLFMSVKLPAGQHTFEMRFWPEGLTKGIIISLAALLALIAIMIVHLSKRTKKAGTLPETAAEGQKAEAAKGEPPAEFTEAAEKEGKQNDSV